MIEVVPPQLMPENVINIGTRAETFEGSNALAQQLPEEELDALLRSNKYGNNPPHEKFIKDPIQKILDLRHKDGFDNPYDLFLYNISGNTERGSTDSLPELSGYWGDEAEEKVKITERVRPDGYTKAGDLVQIREWRHPTNGQIFFFPVIANLHETPDSETNTEGFWEYSADVIAVEGDPDTYYLSYSHEAPIISLSRSTRKAMLYKGGEWLEILPLNDLVEGVAQRELGTVATKSEVETPIAA